MKYLITLLSLVLYSHLALAQKWDSEHYIYSTSPNDKLEPEFAFSEIGLTTGLVIADKASASARLQVLSRVGYHMQVSFMFTYAGNSDLMGPGGSLNFPIGSRRSYVYPGVQLSWFFASGLSGGFHFGYNASISKLISINIEPEISFVDHSQPTNAVFLLLAGVRFSL